MLRTIWLTMENEARLLVKDPVVLLMLVFAPVVIITVAGYSLGSLYGGAASSFQLPVVDLDHGPVSDGIRHALRQERSLSVEMIDDPDEARRLVSQRDRTPVAIVIPAGTSAAVAAGGVPRLILFVDPVRRIEVNALEVRLNELCRRVIEAARATAQQQVEAAANDLRASIKRLSVQIASEQSQVRSEFARTQVALERSIHKQITAALKRVREATEATVMIRERQAWDDVQRQLARRQAILEEIQNYLIQLQSSQRDFEVWLAKLKTMAGSRASDIPPPPSFPKAISESELAELGKPLTPPRLDVGFANTASVDAFTLTIPAAPQLRDWSMLGDLERLQSLPTPTLPGDLAFVEDAAIEGETATVNAFDQYVPGFGITFLLIGMMLGIALTLFDERDWGTLKRFQASGASLIGLLLGKLMARLFVGVAQMVILLAVGWALFGITLGRNPLALLIPTVGISFAAAALGLVVASVSRAHDSVMPLGVTVSMAMAAIGGCWWPLDFEPGWMRQVARWLPTTWTMQAFNDLMIRNQPPSATLWPFVATVGIGMIFLGVGLINFVRSDA